MIIAPDIHFIIDERRVQALLGASEVLGVDAPPSALIELAEWIIAGPIHIRTDGPITQEHAEKLRDALAHAQV